MASTLATDPALVFVEISLQVRDGLAARILSLEQIYDGVDLGIKVLVVEMLQTTVDTLGRLGIAASALVQLVISILEKP